MNVFIYECIFIYLKWNTGTWIECTGSKQEHLRPLHRYTAKQMCARTHTVCTCVFRCVSPNEIFRVWETSEILLEAVGITQNRNRKLSDPVRCEHRPTGSRRKGAFENDMKCRAACALLRCNRKDEVELQMSCAASLLGVFTHWIIGKQPCSECLMVCNSPFYFPWSG